MTSTETDTAIEIVTTTPDRLDPGVFDIPVSDIRIGYRSAVYFNRAKRIAQIEKPDTIVTMQVFCKANGLVCGLDEVIAILKTCSGYFNDPDQAWQLHHLVVKARQQARLVRPGIYRPGLHPATDVAHEYEMNLKRIAGLERDLETRWTHGWEDLEVRALRDGRVVMPWEPVLTITGPYHLFAHLESVYLGILARQSRIATNTWRVTRAAHSMNNDRPVLFFADRFDHYATQGGDGYAAKIGGAQGFATDAMLQWWGDRGTGTMPHSLIALYDGDTCAATEAFAKHYPDTDLIALVDFNNDCVADSVRCLKTFGEGLWGVRLDTSEKMIDRCITEVDMGEESVTGVNPTLVHKVRSALDANGGRHVKIIVSGGFTAAKIREFEGCGVPVDIYAVGSSLLAGQMDFTADIVDPCAKQGRWKRPSRHLERVE